MPFASGSGDHELRFSPTNVNTCTAVPEEDLIDCYPDTGVNREGCEKRGCCWRNRQSGRYHETPSCHFPLNYPSYTFSNFTRTSFGFTFDAIRSIKTFRPNDIMRLRGQVYIFENGILRLKVCTVCIYEYSID